MRETCDSLTDARPPKTATERDLRPVATGKMLVGDEGFETSTPGPESEAGRHFSGFDPGVCEKRANPALSTPLPEREAVPHSLQKPPGVSEEWCAQFPKAAAYIINSLAARIDDLERSAPISPALEQDCPHAAPFRYCPTCVVKPCPIGLGDTK